MDRRDFLRVGLSTPAVLAAQKGPPREERVERMVPDGMPDIALNHLGFLPKARKVVIYRWAGESAPEELVLRDIASAQVPFRQTRKLKRVTSDVIDCLVGDFSDIEREGMYQLSIGD